LKILNLIENAPHPGRPDLSSEHGLSFLVSHRGHWFLSDVGKSGAFADNATRMGLDLSKVDALAITHHHFDHGGGLGRFFDSNKGGHVFLRHSSVTDYIVEGDSTLPRYVGLDHALLSAHADRVTWLDEDCEILPGLHLLVNIPSLHPKPTGDRRLRMQVDDQVLPDNFEHELVTVVVDPDGLVVLTGCAHNGVLNVVEAAAHAFPKLPIKGLVGGLHLAREDADTVRQVGEKLLAMDIPAIYTGHCTGDESTQVLKSVLGSRLHALHTGIMFHL